MACLGRLHVSAVSGYCHDSTKVRLSFAWCCLCNLNCYKHLHTQFIKVTRTPNLPSIGAIWLGLVTMAFQSTPRCLPSCMLSYCGSWRHIIHAVLLELLISQITGQSEPSESACHTGRALLEGVRQPFRSKTGYSIDFPREPHNPCSLHCDHHGEWGCGRNVQMGVEWGH